MKKIKKTILIVDDTETNIDILLELLGDKYDIVVSLDGLSALKTLQDESVDLVLLDIMMPNMDCYEVCREIKGSEKSKDIPVIFITAKTDEDSIEKAYHVGGVDYVVKPFKPRELLARVETHLKLSGLVQHLEFISSYDEMTAIYNRRKFFELASALFSETKENLYAVMIDIDKFKDINDLHGHPAGDKVIQCITKIISQNISDEAIFGRIGGEEFAILCTEESQELITDLIEDIREQIAKEKFSISGTATICCTISQGIAKRKEDMKSLDELLKEADIALYEAKGSGRNRVIFR
ncbi:MAG: diguanylate cyclase response regulator [Epsilonproteobacteria bacterium]|nr:MAG: diguanylate cyclase response regulator [Campylobacterota bacterium]